MDEVASQTQPENVNPDFQVLLHAVSSCAGAAVLQIIKHNPSIVNQKGWNGHSPLHRACLSGDTNIVRLLCENGADPNSRNDFDETPVHYAAKRGIPTIVHILVNYGAKLDVRDRAGKTPIHSAAETGSVYMLKYFEDQGFGFKDTDDKGSTPLHSVCTYGHLDAFKFLLRKGRSDPSLANKDGETALHVCVREGYAHGSWILITMLGISSIHVPNAQGVTPVDLIKQFEFSKKEGHILLLTFLNELVKQPHMSKVSGPIYQWYFNLMMPSIVYFLAILVAQFVLSEYQGLVYVAAVGFIIKSAVASSHRLIHISRWSNPMMAGCFAAGMLHTMLVYYWNIADSVNHGTVLTLCILANFVQLYLYYQLLKADPGTVVTSIVNEKTGRPTQLTELCEAEASLDSFCTECEIIKTKVTKHCKICEKCYYRMDHHCLFLLKCIGYNNHTRFVWFIILTDIVMAIFVLQGVLWILDKYPRADFTYSEIFLELFWRNCWVLSMMFLNIASIVWAASLIQFQLKVVARGHTTYFQHKVSILTPTEKLINVVNFLLGKAPFALGLSFDSPLKSNKIKRDVHTV